MNKERKQSISVNFKIHVSDLLMGTVQVWIDPVNILMKKSFKGTFNV